MHDRVCGGGTPQTYATVHEASTYSRYLDLVWCSTNSIQGRCSPSDFQNENMHMAISSILPKETQHKLPHSPQSINFLWIFLEYSHMCVGIDVLRALNI